MTENITRSDARGNPLNLAPNYTGYASALVLCGSRRGGKSNTASLLLALAQLAILDDADSFTPKGKGK